jgi:hypothetical protein
MARKRDAQQHAAAAAAAAAAAGNDDATVPKGAVVDGASQRVFVPLVTESSDPEAVQSTDTVAEVLAGNYSQGIVDEVGVACFDAA